jgi:CheY-like chemotaxis protein
MKREPSGVVLYVEDNRINFLLVEQLMMIWSLVELHHAEDGARALELARAVEPDLVILDLPALLLGMAGGRDPGSINWPESVRRAAASAGITLP